MKQKLPVVNTYFFISFITIINTSFHVAFLLDIVYGYLIIIFQCLYFAPIGYPVLPRKNTDHKESSKNALLNPNTSFTVKNKCLIKYYIIKLNQNINIIIHPIADLTSCFTYVPSRHFLNIIIVKHKQDHL